MPVPLFAFVLVLLAFTGVAYPLRQAIGNAGIVYYTNGNDEATYLQYDYARAAVSPTRPGELLVTWAHLAGISGGWLNVVFDVITPPAFVLLAWVIFRQIGMQAGRARLAAVALAVVPLLASSVNPLVHDACAWSVKSGWCYWLDMPEQITPAIWRTPEPQLSLLLELGAIAIALRFRTVWPVFLAAPFLYPFVGTPAAFVAGGWWLERSWQARGLPYPSAGPLVVMFSLLAGSVAAFYASSASASMRLVLVPSHAPMVSLTSLLAIAIYAAARESIAEEWRYVALTTAVMPMALCNQQVLSGHFGQPDNHEQFAGIFAVALVLVLADRAWPSAYRASIAAGLILFLWAGAASYVANDNLNAGLPFDDRLAFGLRTHPRQVAVDDLQVASVLTMVYPREATTALGYDQAFAAVADRYIASYRCTRRRVLAEQGAEQRFVDVVHELDHAYTLGSQDYVMAHVFHKHHFLYLWDVTHGCDPADDRPLDYFFVGRPTARMTSKSPSSDIAAPVRTEAGSKRNSTRCSPAANGTARKATNAG